MQLLCVSVVADSGEPELPDLPNGIDEDIDASDVLNREFVTVLANRRRPKKKEATEQHDPVPVDQQNGDDRRLNMVRSVVCCSATFADFCFIITIIISVIAVLLQSQKRKP